MKTTCSICDEIAIFKIKGENIFYCKKHAEEFFNIDSLEIITNKLLQNKNEAIILKKFLFEKN